MQSKSFLYQVLEVEGTPLEIKFAVAPQLHVALNREFGQEIFAPNTAWRKKQAKEFYIIQNNLSRMAKSCLVIFGDVFLGV